MKTNHVLINIEERFKKVTGYGDLSKFPLRVSSGYMTDREKSREFAEVFTPPHIVDEMLQSVPDLGSTTRNLDLCAGHGQFTIRMLRKFSQEIKSFDVLKYLKTKHFFAELQLESCYKLLWTFGTGINLAIGDALQLAKLPSGWRGIWLYVEKADVWVNITYIIKSEVQVSLDANLVLFPYDEGEERSFVALIDRLRVWLNRVAKEPKMELDKLVNIPAGRELLKTLVRNVATDVEENWQNVKTPEWVAREMVRCIPDLKLRSKILVLFNIELLDALIKEGVSVSRITFGSDSPLEEALAQGMYKVTKTIPIGQSLEEMKKALEGKSGQYEVVLSNPPYQVMDGGFKASARPIYHEIVMYAIDELKAQYVCMVTPSRWMAGGKGLDDYRARMLKDKHLRLIQDFPQATGENAVFNANIPGGVSYFLWDRDYNGLCDFNGIQRDIGEFDVLVRDNVAHQILKKVLVKHTGVFCNGKVLHQKPFGLRTNFRDWVSADTEGAVKCYTNRREIRYVVETQTTGNPCLKWIVFGARATGYNGEVFAKESGNVGYRNVFVGEAGAICTETYLVLGSFGTKKEAENYYAYTQTKFFQFLLSLRVITQDVNTKRFSWVPDLGSYSQPYTDEDLYTHFNLTKKEIEHIEYFIK